MRITGLHIENFRSIKSLDVELGETTVFIGSNNAGKTAILDAVRISLTHRWGQRAKVVVVWPCPDRKERN